MIKQVTYSQEVVKQHKYCDDCGAEIRIGLACSKAACEYCGKDLCEMCIDHEDYSSGDYRTVYCKKCTEIYNEYADKIADLEKKLDDTDTEMRNRCRDARDKATSQHNL